MRFVQVYQDATSRYKEICRLVLQENYVNKHYHSQKIFRLVSRLLTTPLETKRSCLSSRRDLFASSSQHSCQTERPDVECLQNREKILGQSVEDKQVLVQSFVSRIIKK